jgi:hypothetical protein
MRSLLMQFREKYATMPELASFFILFLFAGSSYADSVYDPFEPRRTPTTRSA